MVTTKLIMPKQTGQLDSFKASLKIYFESYQNGNEWLSNEIFKQKIQEELPSLSEGAKNSPYLEKQSELTRYFGLVDYDYSHRKGKARITKTGIDFYKACLSNNETEQKDIIMEAVFKLSFGRNNKAIKSSNSDIDPPKLFLKAIQDLNGITKKELAYLIYLTNDLNIDYPEAILKLSKTRTGKEEIFNTIPGKYNDTKFPILMDSLGVVEKNSNNVYMLTNFIKENYSDRLKILSIYNTDKNDEENNSIEYQLDILTSQVYDTNSEEFKSQNNRKPVICSKNKEQKYKVNKRISKTALEMQNYKCLYDLNHQTFPSKMGKPYMEAHHLIPMSAQKDFDINIDRIENIVSICPLCHSAIHLGNNKTRLELLTKLYEIKKDELKNVGLNILLEELFSKYYQ